MRGACLTIVLVLATATPCGLWLASQGPIAEVGSPHIDEHALETVRLVPDSRAGDLIEAELYQAVEFTYELR